MVNGNVPTNEYELDWEQITLIIDESFSDPKEREMLYCHFLLKGEIPRTVKELAKRFGLKRKEYIETIVKLEKRLYRRLKAEDIDGLLESAFFYDRSVGAVVVDEEEVLLLKHLQGHWSFPKGHPENDESDMETAEREIKEETNLSVRFIAGFKEETHYMIDPRTKKTVSYYLARPTSKSLKAQPEEIEEIRWFSFNEALQTITFEEDRVLLQKVIDFLKENRE
ncbi:bis(5'-nucleosyl)-tetraphosphatase [Guggenheimella bovis]